MNEELEHDGYPDGSFSHSGPLKPIHVPLDEMGAHPILRWAVLTGEDRKGPLAWPGLNFEQRQSVSDIRVIDDRGTHKISIPPRVNLDFFVNSDTDEEAPPFWKGRANDLQRFYTRCSDTGFLIVGIFTAITIDGVRRYFRWATGSWDELGQNSFLYNRDNDDTHFAETETETIEQVAPGAVKLEPERQIPEPTPVEYFDVDVAQLLQETDGDEREDEDGEDGDDEDDDLMTEVDAISQQGHASAIASIAHRGQVDKLGYDYIDHPARVAANFDWLDQPVEHCVAWLHDVIEDSDVTSADLLKAGMLPEIVEAVELLTRQEEASDEVYYERIREHPVALAVKLADIDDNLADWRFRKLDYETQVRLSNKYFRARQLLANETEEP